MSKNDELVLASSDKPQTAVDKIPIIARFAVSDRAKQTLNLVRSRLSILFTLPQTLLLIEDTIGREIRRRRMHTFRHSLPLAARRRLKEMDHLSTHNR